MSTFKRKGATTFSYDFQIAGIRYTGETTATSERDADTIERAKKAEAREKQRKDREDVTKIGQNGNVDLTLAPCFDRYYNERGKHAENAEQIFQGLGLILKYFQNRKVTAEDPKIESLRQITQAEVAKLVAWRRSHTRWNRPGEKLISTSQVNRSTTEVMRRVYVYARDVWQIDGLPRVKWGGRKGGKGGLVLKETGRRLRTVHDHEELTIAKAIRPDMGKYREFLLESCLRANEALLRWDQIDLSRRIAFLQQKGDNVMEKELSDECMEIILSCRGDHPEYVFTYTAQMNLRKRVINGKEWPAVVKGRKYPMTYVAWDTYWYDLRKRLGISGLTTHDHRRTGVSAIARTKGMQYAQVAAGHADGQSTILYVGDIQPEIRDAMSAGSSARKERIARLAAEERGEVGQVIPIDRRKA